MPKVDLVRSSLENETAMQPKVILIMICSSVLNPAQSKVLFQEESFDFFH